MKTRLSAKQIGKRIMKIRTSKGLSQEDLARLLNISRPSLAQIELGNRNISVIEFMKLSEVLGFSMDKFLASEYNIEEEISMVAEDVAVKEHIRVSVPCFKSEKFRNVLLYILERCAGKPNVGETVLNKLLYFSDMDYYEKYEEHLTGSRYSKLPFGPVPQELDQVFILLILDGQLQRIKTEYRGYPQTRYLPLKRADL
ncbi:MAG: helix-turn-helix domain-containing protein [Bacteroidales bacterium]|nr:helix-turn-helix domain-containing protein [Bacteroidales bacterium]